MTTESIDPATGKTRASFAELSDADLDRRLDRATQAFRAHRATPFSERAKCLRQAAEVLEGEKRTFGELMTSEMGKPIGAAVAEAEKCAWVCRYYADEGERFLAEENVETDARRSFVRFDPLGPVLAVMPWNFPFWQVFRFAAPALAAGNVGLLKHASNVPACALAIEDVFRRAGFAEGAFQTLLIGSARVAAVVADDRIAAVTLTGSEGAGVSVGAAAGKALKRSVLELGGSDPFVVMPSADVAAAAETAVKARTINSGQSCIAAKRFILHDSIADEFRERFVARMRALRVGNPMDPATDVGPLATPSILSDVEDQVRRTVAAGARVLLGGERIPGPGNFYAPTVLDDVPADSPAAVEEVFGPVAALFRAKDLDEAIAIANRSRFGLGASCWTRDDAERERFVREIESGSVFVNGMVKSDPRLPFGGVKRSGYGRELAREGIREFVNVKTIWIG